jgi:hypothetical protein
MNRQYAWYSAVEDRDLARATAELNYRRQALESRPAADATGFRRLRQPLLRLFSRRAMAS